MSAPLVSAPFTAGSVGVRGRSHISSRDLHPQARRLGSAPASCGISGPRRLRRPRSAVTSVRRRRGLRSQKAERAVAEAGPPRLGARPARYSPALRGPGAMTLFHFGNCFALAYFPYFITYKCSGL